MLMNPGSKFLLKQGGAAMVEFSILMIVLVPLILYGFYICDAAFFTLEVQESVISATWDVTSRNHEVGDGHGSDSNHAGVDQDTKAKSGAYDVTMVQEGARLEYSDHTSAYDDPSDPYSNNAEAWMHHTEMAAHVCYIGQEQDATDAFDQATYDDRNHSSQVTCTLDHKGDLDWMNFGLSFGAAADINPAFAFGNSALNRSGVVGCVAKAWVYNYLIPDTFMQEHSHVNLTNDATKKKTDVSTTVHTNLGANVFLHDRAAVSFGTWAVEDGSIGGRADGKKKGFTGEDVVDSDTPFYRRVRDIYYGSGTPFDGNAGMGLNALNATYLNVQLEAGNLATTALSKVEIIPAVGYLTSNSLLGFTGASLGSLLNELGTEPADPVIVYMTEVWSPGNGDRTLRCASLLDLACAAGPQYETSPSMKSGDSNNNPAYATAFGNRGAYYMGATSATTEWSP